MERERLVMLDAECDRCGKLASALRPYKFSTVTYRGKTLEMPWLCSGCFKIEKAKAWKALRV